MTAGATVDMAPTAGRLAGVRPPGLARLIIDDDAAENLWLDRPAASSSEGDSALLDRCTGPTLDVGCGAGRMAAGLTARGVPVLGVDVSPTAVATTIAAGALALQRNIFGAVPGDGRWRHVLLADGNIGIGGDPAGLLVRCSELLTIGGSVLVDLAPPGTGLQVRRVRLQVDGRTSDWFRWAWLGADAVSAVAAQTGLTARDIWCAGSRWQAELRATDDVPSVPEVGGEQ